MRKLSTVALVIVAIAIAVAFLIYQLPNSGDNPETAANGGTADIPIPSDATVSHIAYVYDGDTLYLQPDGTTSRADEIKVRLIGVDTPELRPSVECFGIEARDYLRSLLPEGTAVRISSDVEEFDQYGRSLLYLWTEDGTSVNLELVENGYAAALRIAPSDTYWKQFDLAQSAARQANAGLWGSC
jgi:endonuclease YncB( thermonuclease family)